MLDPITMFKEGGPFMYLILLSAIFLVPTVPVAGLLAFLRVRVPAALWLAAAVLPFVFGLVGTYYGAGLALDVLPIASEGMRHKLAANGLSVALYTMDAGAAVSALVLASLAGVLGVGGLASRLRAQPDSPKEQDAAEERTAALRLAVGGFTALAFGFALLQTTSHAFALASQAQANATMEMRAMLQARAFEGFWLQQGVFALALVASLMIGALSVGSRAPRLLSTRSVASGVASALVLTVLTLLAGGTGWRLVTLHAASADPAEAIAEALAEQGIQPPQVPAADLQVPLPGPTLTFGPSEVRQDGRLVTPDTFQPVEAGSARTPVLWLHAHRDTRLAEIAPFAPRLFDVELAWLMEGLNGLGARPSRVASSPTEAEHLVARYERGRWRVAHALPDGHVVDLELDGATLDELLVRAHGRHPDLSEVHAWFTPDATVQPLAELLAVELPRGRRFEVVWRMDPAPPFEAPSDLPEPVPASEIRVQGSLEADLIQRVVRRAMPQIRYCYQRELTKNPSLRGQMTVKFLISPSGKVASATSKESTLDSSSVEACVSGRFMRMVFPEPPGGGIVIVNYPLVFASE